MKSILVGLDGSEDCGPAIELGICWAKRYDCLLVGMAVVDEPTIRGHQIKGLVSSAYQAAYDQLLTKDRRDVDLILEQFALRCSSEQVPIKLLEDEGQPCDQILTEMQRFDLMILGGKTHFRHASKHHPCNTLTRVLRCASRPIVVAPRPVTSSSGEAVVVAYDGSVQVARALQAFVGIGLANVWPVHIVSVHPRSTVEAARTADRAAQYLRSHDIESTCVPLVADLPAIEFIEYANQTNAEMIVMGAFGQSKVTELFLGSATCAALRDSSVPLFLYH